MGSKALKKNDFRQSISTSAGRHPIFTSLRNRTSISTADRFPKTALTPLSRLKKFKKVRDRNLRKLVLNKSAPARKSIMMETLASSSETAMSESVKSSPKKSESTNSSPMKMENGGLNGIPEESPIVENGHQYGHENGHKEEEMVPVRRSPRKNEVKEDMVTLHDADTEEEESEGELVDERPLKVLHLKDGPPASPSSASKRRQRDEEGDSSSDREDYVPYPSTRNIRIEGRPPIRRESFKRKAHEMEPLPDENSPKKMAYTPSVSSPGWKFFSSPFSKFWPNRAPCEDDSLVVNLSTDSGATEEPTSIEPSLMNDTAMSEEEEESFDKPTRDPPQKGWSCAIM